MTGTVNGCSAEVFDLVYRNVGSGGGGTTTSRQTMYAISSPQLNLPEFYLRPEGMMERILDKISRVDIDITERPVFSSKMLLYGKDEAAIRRLFTDPRLEYFETNSQICVFGRGSHLFYYLSRSTTPSQQVPRNVNFLISLLQLFQN